MSEEKEIQGNMEQGIDRCEQFCPTCEHFPCEIEKMTHEQCPVKNYYMDDVKKQFGEIPW